MPEVTLRITQVTYRRVANLGNYETAAMEAVAAVNEGEDPAEVMTALKQWVEGRIKPAPAQPQAPMPTPRPNGIPPSEPRFASEAQLRMIFAVGTKDLGMTSEEVESDCERRCGKAPQHLTVAQAISYIDALKSLALERGKKSEATP